MEDTLLTPGLLEDNRDDVAKSKDYLHTDAELASAVPLNWIERDPTTWKAYPARNQWKTSTCVAQAAAKALYVLGYDILSAHPQYRGRKNFPGEGMYLYDVGDLIKKPGTVLESIDPSQMKLEVDMNAELSAVVKEELKYTQAKGFTYVFVQKSQNWFEDIAQQIEQHGHCLLTFGSNYTEWTSIPAVNGEVKWGHCVCAIDYVIYKGKKYIVIEDSWGANATEFDDRRLISEEFLMARGTGAMYFLKPQDVIPVKFKFTRNLKKGDTGNDVVKLQDVMKYLGYMSDSIPSNGIFGPRTFEAVCKFQAAYVGDILKPAGLSAPTGVIGYYSIKKLNELLMQNTKWFLSSAGSGDLSLTFKGALLGVVPVLVALATMQGYAISQDQVVQVVNQGFAVASGIVMFVGLVRKIYKSVYK